MKKTLLFLLISSLIPHLSSFSAGTPVMFPLQSFFNGASYTRALTITSAHPWLTDGTNIFTGSFITVTPIGGTNPIVNLQPNDYLLNAADARVPLRFSVSPGTNVVNVLTLITNGLLSWYPIIYGGWATNLNNGTGSNLWLQGSFSGDILDVTGAKELDYSQRLLKRISGGQPQNAVDYQNCQLSTTPNHSPNTTLDWYNQRLIGNWTADAIAGDGSSLTNMGYFTPAQFGAVSDGVTDDTMAISNLFYAVNQHGPGITVDFQWRTNVISATMPTITVGRVELKNFNLYYTSTNGWPIGHGCGYLGSEFWVHDGSIIRIGTNRPNTNSFAINLRADQGTSYYSDTKVERVEINNFWDAVMGGPTSGAHFTLMRIYGAWNSDFHYPANVDTPDMIEISMIDCDQANNQRYALNQFQSTNMVALRFEVQCHGLFVHDSNIGGSCKQVFSNLGGTPNADVMRINWVNNNSGSFRNADTNIVWFELWNGELTMLGSQMGGESYGSNALAQVGLYGTNGGHLNLAADYIRSPNIASVDIWSSEGRPYGTTDFPQICGNGNITIRHHVTYKDTGTLWTFPYQFGTFGSGWTGGTNYTYAYPYGAGNINLWQWATLANQGNTLKMAANAYADFSQASGVYLPGPALSIGAGASEYGGGNPWDWYAKYSGRWRIYSGSGGVLTSFADFEVSNSVVFVRTNLVVTGTATAGAFIGNGAGLTNVTPVAATNRTVVLPLNRFYDMWSGTYNMAQSLPQGNFRGRFLGGTATGCYAVLTPDEVAGFTNFVVTLYLDATNAATINGYIFGDYYQPTSGAQIVSETTRSIVVASNALNAFSYTRSFAPSATNGAYQLGIYPATNPTNIWLLGGKVLLY